MKKQPIYFLILLVSLNFIGCSSLLPDYIPRPGVVFAWFKEGTTKKQADEALKFLMVANVKWGSGIKGKVTGYVRTPPGTRDTYTELLLSNPQITVADPVTDKENVLRIHVFFADNPNATVEDLATFFNQYEELELLMDGNPKVQLNVVVGFEKFVADSLKQREIISDAYQPMDYTGPIY